MTHNSALRLIQEGAKNSSLVQTQFGERTLKVPLPESADV